MAIRKGTLAFILSLVMSAYFFISYAKGADNYIIRNIIQPTDEEILKSIIQQQEEFSKINFASGENPNKKNNNQITLDKIEVKSFKAEDATLRSVLYGILQDTDIGIVFDPDVDTSKRITVQFKNTNLGFALKNIMEIAKLNYEIDGNVLRIKSTITKMFKLPYVKTTSSYSSSLGGNITGGVGGGVAGGGVTTGVGSATTVGASAGMTGSFSVSYGIDEEVMNLYSQIEENVKNILSERGKFTLNRMTGILTVEDYPDRVNLVENFLAKIKREIDKQVLIEAKIIEVSLSDSYQFGIDWRLLIRNALGGSVSFSQTLSLSSSAASVTVTSADFNAILNAIASVGKFETLANPRVLVMNNQTALISSGQIVPFWDKQVNVVGGTATTQPLTTVTYTRRNILDGVLLGVTPHIEDDGDITLNIIPISTTILGTRQYMEGNTVVAEAPIINVKEAGTIVKSKNNDIIIIGGLIDKSDKVNETKVPLLGDIPFVGNLFKQKSVSQQRKELIILMKVFKVDKDSPY